MVRSDLDYGPFVKKNCQKITKEICQSLWDGLITINLSISPHSIVLAAIFRDRLHHSDGPHPPRQSRTRRKQMQLVKHI